VTDDDTLADADLDSAVNDDQGTPPTVDCVASYKNRLWMCGDSNYPYRVWYTEKDKPDNVASTNYLDLERSFGKVVNLVVMHGILFFIQSAGVSRLYGETTEVFTPGETNSHVGAYGRWTPAVGPDGIYFLGSDGVYKFNGLQSTRVSDSISRTFGKLSSTWVDVVNWDGAKDDARACFLNGKYYLQIPLSSSLGTTVNRLLVLDVMHTPTNQTWERHDIDTDCLHSNKEDGEIYGSRVRLGEDTTPFSVYKIGHSTRNADDTPTPAFVSRAYRLGKPLSWAENKKGHITSVEEPSLDFIKEYRIDGKGTWSITFYVDGVNRYAKQHSGLGESDRTTWHKVDPKIKGGQCVIVLEAAGTRQPSTCSISEVEVR